LLTSLIGLGWYLRLSQMFRVSRMPLAPLVKRRVRNVGINSSQKDKNETIPLKSTSSATVLKAIYSRETPAANWSPGIKGSPNNQRRKHSVDFNLAGTLLKLQKTSLQRNSIPRHQTNLASVRSGRALPKPISTVVESNESRYPGSLPAEDQKIVRNFLHGMILKREPTGQVVKNPFAGVGFAPLARRAEESKKPENRNYSNRASAGQSRSPSFDRNSQATAGLDFDGRSGEAFEGPNAIQTLYLDGASLGRWMVQHLEWTLARPTPGMTGIDPRATLPRSRVAPF
jgi:hypothetical protein